ncbi:DUF1566 domain-containing protein [Marinomonas algicola]|uniref:Lcl C-terminal domain-containing protein n=1 Tax=Marinomonas algicola TaxID=2773454 RepID=UPI00174E0EA0|nr:DUF1566 domain-containing protein [Marinomonas algicola]
MLKAMRGLVCLSYIGLCSFSYAETQVNCKPDNIVASTPTTRFTLNADETVTDLKTGLMWKQCPEGMSGSQCDVGSASVAFWDVFLRSVEVLNAGEGFAGFNDWRVPNVKELRSIVEAQCYRPAINLEVFPNTPIVSFFTSTPVKDIFRDNIWVVEFIHGRIESKRLNVSGSLRLVRNAEVN